MDEFFTMINLTKVTHFIHNRQLLYEATVIVQVCYFRIICTDWTKKDCRNLCIRCAKGDIKKRFATFASIVGRARHTRSRQTERTREVREASPRVLRVSRDACISPAR